MSLFSRGGLVSVLMASAVSVSAWAGLDERTSVAAYRSMVSGEVLEFSCNYSTKHLSAGGWIVGGGLSYHPTGETTPGGHNCYQLSDAGTSLYEGYIEKYTEAGVLDTTFGTDTDGDGTHEGRVRVAVKNGTTERGGMDVRVAVQSDGDIVAAWTVFPVSGESFVRVARYTEDGELDTGFGTLGYKNITFSVPAPAPEPPAAPLPAIPKSLELRDIALLSSGDVVVLSQAKTSPHRIYLTILNSDGSVQDDNDTGYALPALSLSPDALVIGSSSQIYVSGNSSQSAFLLRFNTAAELDAEFADSGVYKELNGSGESRYFRSIAAVGGGLYLLRSTYGADGKWRCGVLAVTGAGETWNDETVPDGSDFETANATDSNYCTGFAQVTAESSSNWIVAGSHNGKRALFLLDSFGRLKESGNSNFSSGVWVSTSADSPSAYQVLAEADNKLLIGGFSGNNRLWTFLDFSVGGTVSSESGGTTGGAGLFLLPFLMLVFRRRH